MIKGYEEIRISHLEEVLGERRIEGRMETVLTQDVYNIGKEAVLVARDNILTPRLRARLEEDIEIGMLCYRKLKR